MRPYASVLVSVLPAGFVPPVLPLGIASWGPPLLVLAGLLMLAMELFVVPGFGVAGVIGLAAMAAGIVLALVGPFPGALDVVVASAALVSGVTMIGVVTWGVAQRLRAGHPLLGGSLEGDGYRAALPRAELQGAEGIAATDLRPAGSADILGERLDVVAEGGWVPAGTPVRVVASEGWRLVVQAVPLLDEDPGEGEPPPG